MSHREQWQPLLDDLERRRQAARAMGGPEKLARYGASGRSHARARIEMLLDAGSFVEIGTLAGDGVPADAFVAGFGTVEGRPVLVGAEDFTVAGGSIGHAAASKRTRLTVLARQERVPLVLFLEGAGHRPTNGLHPQRPAPGDLPGLTDLAGLVPTVAIAVGPSAGHGALAAPLSDVAIMVEPEGALFTAGPPLVAAATGEQVTKADLGGADVHTRTSPVAHLVAGDDAEAVALVRRYLSYFPTNAWHRPPRTQHGPDTGPRELDEILDVIPPDQRKPYDMRTVVAAVADEGSTTELQPRHGRAVLTVLARIGGRPVAVLANQPLVRAGSLDVDAAHKAARFLQIAGAFHLPVLFLADNPGVLAGSASERAGILRASARLYAAQHRLGVPKIHVTVRKAFGFGSSVMAMNSYDGQTLTLAFPGATLGGIPAAVGGATAKVDDDTRAEMVASESAGPWRLAGVGLYDEVIDPRQLRNVVLDALDLAEDRLTGPAEPVRLTGYLP